MAEEEMLPPPRRPQLSTNADFRKLLETPRAERLGDDSRQSKPKKAAGEQEGQQKPKRKPFRPKPEVEKKEDDGSGYRDRAEERRKGVNPDYERVTADLASLVGRDSVLNPDPLNAISVEDSKFLGGDVDHTHLVKGLDYALLQKVRGEMVKEEDDDRPEAKSSKAPQDREVVKFKGVAGRAVFNAVFSRPRLISSEFFLPGRTVFVFELEGVDGPDLPTTLRRSKADCPPVAESIRGGMDASVLERMVKIMSYMRGSSGKPGKLKKKDKLRMLQVMDGMTQDGLRRPKPEEPARPTGPVDADADIFGDAGRDFVPEVPAPRSAATNGVAREADGMDAGAAVPPPPPPLPEAAVGPARPAGGYDAAEAAYAAYGEPPPPPPPAAQPPAAQDEEDLELDRLAGLAPPPPPLPPEEAQPGKQRSSKRAAEPEIIKEDTEDAYEELYPGYGGFSAGVVDSDDEDLTHMDSKEGKSRYDFETEEQWEKYKGSKEMLPKAAFQFGVKVSDGRKGHKKLGKAFEQKEQKQLQQIESMLKSKHGDDYSKAFSETKEAPREDGIRPGTSKKRRI